MRDWTPRVAPLFLRVLLGATFQYAGLQKLLTPGFFDPRNPASINAQMAYAARTSPIHSLVVPLVPYAGLVGHAIAFGEIAVGIAALFGLFTQLAAIGGVALSLSFWLTVNAHVHPYFFVPDVGWAALWAVLWMLGPGEFLALDNYRNRGQPQAMHPAVPSHQPWPDHGPTWNGPAWHGEPPVRMSRRQIVGFSLAAGGLGAVTLIALRLMHRGPFAGSAGYSPPFSTEASGPADQATPSAAASSSPSASAQAASTPAGQHIGTMAQLPISFNYHNDKQRPAIAVRVSSGTGVRAFSRICTHAGCIVNPPGGGQLYCSCHGSSFSATTGAVTNGPANQPLTEYRVTVAGGRIYVALLRRCTSTTGAPPSPGRSPMSLYCCRFLASQATIPALC